MSFLILISLHFIYSCAVRLNIIKNPEISIKKYAGSTDRKWWLFLKMIEIFN